jgi:hypothetical protein
MNDTNEIDVLLAVHRLLKAGQVTTICGDRIRPEVLEQGEILPAIAYSTITSDDWHDLEGASGEAQTRVQFNCYALTVRDADRLGKAVEDVLDGFAGRLGEGDEVVEVADCVLDNNYRRADPPTPGDRRWRFRRVKDFVVSHSKQLPTLQLE